MPVLPFLRLLFLQTRDDYLLEATEGEAAGLPSHFIQGEREDKEMNAREHEFMGFK